MKKRYRRTNAKQKKSIQKVFVRKSLRHNLKNDVLRNQVFHKNYLNDLIKNGGISTFDLYNVLQRAYCNSESSSTSYSNHLENEQNNNYSNDLENEQNNNATMQELSYTMQELADLRSKYRSNLWNNACQRKQTIVLKPTAIYQSETNINLNDENDLINYKCFEDHLREVSLSSECERTCCQHIQKCHRLYSKQDSF